ncbi:hypothetical protein RIF29_26312 [Crotalaria pallida]|uniref:RNase H type-1 domain-containing protein n=1 Tax=Crotalaria pallida TaxID=3830 RepID=A0AAN9EPU2_CROPI
MRIDSAATVADGAAVIEGHHRRWRGKETLAVIEGRHRRWRGRERRHRRERRRKRGDHHCHRRRWFCCHCFHGSIDKRGSVCVVKHIEKLISWYISSPTGFVKLNVDGSVYKPSRRATCVGLLRDENGDFIEGFTCNLGMCSLVKAELWALLLDLRIVARLGIVKLVELDTKIMIG